MEFLVSPYCMLLFKARFVLHWRVSPTLPPKPRQFCELLLPQLRFAPNNFLSINAYSLLSFTPGGAPARWYCCVAPAQFRSCAVALLRGGTLAR